MGFWGDVLVECLMGKGVCMGVVKVGMIDGLVILFDGLFSFSSSFYISKTHLTYHILYTNPKIQDFR